MYGPQSRYPVPFYVTRPRARVLTWTELEHVGFDPAPFDLGGFSSQYRLPIICPTFDDRGYLSKISYKPIFLPIFCSRYITRWKDSLEDSLGQAIGGFSFWNFSNLFENNNKVSFFLFHPWIFLGISCYHLFSIRSSDEYEYDECRSRPIQHSFEILSSRIFRRTYDYPTILTTKVSR